MAVGAGGTRCEDGCKRKLAGGSGREKNDGIMGARVWNMLNVRGKTGKFS